jgi:hypothetical protein
MITNSAVSDLWKRILDPLVTPRPLLHHPPYAWLIQDNLCAKVTQT